MEIETALRWGYLPDITGQGDKNWFNLPAETRAVLVAHEQLRSLTTQIETYDERQKQAALRGSK